MDLEKLKSKLRTYRREEIIVTRHAVLRARIRKIHLEDIKENIVNPEKLVFAEQQTAQKEGEKKYNCYFAISKEVSHRYVLVTDGKVIIVTIIWINKNWQKIVENKIK
jgi:hypothetical protein